jgi:3',5'-cyclic AMP phosphodiesterase CpdA
MLIAHLSDPHIAAPGTKAYGVVATDEHLAACVKQINSMVPRPDVALLTGDITCNGSLAEVMHAGAILDRLKMPLYLVPGNHDQRETLWQIFGKRAVPEHQGSALSYCLDQFPVRLIGLDTVSPGYPGGAWSREQNCWLQKRLDEKPDLPTLLFLHHPPVKFRVLETDEDGFVGVEKLAGLVAQYSNILAVVCGHIHLQAHALWQGTVVSTAPSMGLHLVLDLTLQEPSRFIPDIAGYQLHYISGQGKLVSHCVMLGRQAEPCLFEEQAE